MNSSQTAVNATSATIKAAKAPGSREGGAWVSAEGFGGLEEALGAVERRLETAMTRIPDDPR